MVEDDARDRERAQTVEAGSIGQLRSDSRRPARDGDGGLGRARKASLAHKTSVRIAESEESLWVASPCRATGGRKAPVKWGSKQLKEPQTPMTSTSKVRALGEALLRRAA